MTTNDLVIWIFLYIVSIFLVYISMDYKKNKVIKMIITILPIINVTYILVSAFGQITRWFIRKE